ncbi:MAG TPA: iron-containing alcohol dehydrogenase [Candidatus Polarisedimenticolia bacterium]|nr:iron-containing alcohol dehydrogenase [Candidatus Polarisedimenticolia bacterium]
MTRPDAIVPLAASPSGAASEAEGMKAPEGPPAGAAWAARFGGSQVVGGPGSLAAMGELGRRLGGRRALLVTDPGVRAAGHAARGEQALREAGLEVALFDGVEENPTTRHVEAGTAFARELRIDLIAAVGGGSAMDCAKGINFLLTNGGRMEDYWGTGLAARPMLPSIAAPTTAGTGSEAQCYALIEQEGTRRKMACGDEKARFAAVVLDPDLTATCPRRVRALTGMDAISHAVESLVSLRGSLLSEALSREAWRLLSGSFARVLEGSDEVVRQRMLVGAHLAGAAVEASMLGAAHAAANPLTSRFQIPHGAAVLLMLPHVVRYNAAVVAARYDELAAEVVSGGAGGLAGWLESARTLAGLPERLSECGVARTDLPSLAADAACQWTGRFNPRPATSADFERLYDAAW